MFSSEYLAFCRERSGEFRGKIPLVGDWYADPDAGTIAVLARRSDARSLPPSAYFVPDLDDLLEMLDAQLRAIGESPAEVQVKMMQRGGGWELEYVLADGTLVLVGPRGTLHVALYESLYQLAAVGSSRRGACDHVAEGTPAEVEMREWVLPPEDDPMRGAAEILEASLYGHFQAARRVAGQHRNEEESGDGGV